MRKICCLTLFLSFLAVASGQPSPSKTLAALPQGFEPNRGQAGPSVDFISRGPGYTVSLTAEAAHLQLVSQTAPSAALSLRLVGANPSAGVKGADPQPGKSNYFLGNDSRNWLTDVPQYGRVEYRQVYPGIDVTYHGNNQRLEYDFILAPHADPSKIRLAVDGADRVQIDQTGDLVLTVGSAEIREPKPAIYQETANGRRFVDGSYVSLDGDRVGFALGSYDANSPLTIDPIVVFSSFFGSTGLDLANGIALDSNANVYMCGVVGAGTFHGSNIGSPGFTGAQTAAFVLKVSSSGTLISSTFIAGGNDTATATGVALDGNGNIYLSGNTSSASFPTLNAAQKTYGGGGDGFALELNNAGNSLIYSTYIGGSGSEATYGVGVDVFGNTLVSGYTTSKNLPVVNATQATLTGTANAFAVKIASGGSSLVYSTYYGGSGADYGEGMALDESGDLVFFGITSSTNFPVLNAYQPSFCGWSQGQKVSNSHGFVAKLSPTGVPVFSTYVCGSVAADGVRAGATDAQGNIILTGYTGSLTFPTLNPIQASFAGGTYDAFLMRFSPAGTLLFSTYMGGNGSDVGRGVALDQLGNFYVTGSTSSTNFPTVNPTQKNLGGGDDAFLTKINAAASAIVFSTFIGGSAEDLGEGVAVDGLANAYIAGWTASSNFPTVSPFQPAYGGGSWDGFVAAISTCSFTFSSQPTFSIAGGTGTVTITTTPECGWSAASNSSWITITSSPESGAGSGSVSYSVAANSGSTRQGSLTIGGQIVSIPQNGVPVLNVAETNASSFTQGQNGATYTATVSNSAGSGPTTGTVTLTQTLPSALTLVSMAGTGWSCTGAVCSRSDALGAGTTYPAVTVTVNVAANASTPQAAQVSVSGGGALSPATATDTTTINSAAPALTVTEINSASFTQGQPGAAYTVTVTNSAAVGATAGTVTLTQTLPAGLTLVSMAGTGWSCTGAVCTRSDVLAAGASYPAVTVMVNVANNAASPLAAQVSVSGGGSATATATDNTTIIPLPVLNVTETNAASFTQGQNGATYTTTVSNSASAGPTNGTVTLTQTLPSALTLVSMAGAGWNCSGAVCSRSDVLAAGASYPAVTVTVNVAANASTPQVAQVSVSGGGALSPATGTDTTTILNSTTPSLTVAEINPASFTQGQSGAIYTVTVSNAAAAGPTSGTVTLSQTLPSGLTLVSMAGTGWGCAGAVCTRSDVLAAGASYPAVTVTVNVANNAASLLAAQVSVSGGGSATATATDNTTIIAVPVLNVTETNAAPFTQGQTGATYTVTVSNSAGAGPTNGAVTLTQTLPSGLTLVSMAGTGWNCIGAVCSRSDVLAAGASYPAVTVTVNVAANASSPQAAQVSVSGGGALSSATATDNTAIQTASTAVLSVSLTSPASFTLGQWQAAYTATVSNGASAGSTAGTVTLADTLPAALTLVSMSGTGWTCAGGACTRSDVLAAGASYPAVTISVNVSLIAPASVTNQVTVSGGGSASATASLATAISPQATTTFTLTNQGPDAVMFAPNPFLTGESYTDNVAQTTNCPTTIGVGVSCSFNLAFNTSPFIYPADWAQYSMYAAADQALIAGPPNPSRLVFIGDSVTAAWDQPAPYGEGSLQAVKPFVNRGIGGQTTEQMLVRFWEDVVKLNPAVVHILGGTNDLGGNVGPETSAEIMDQITSMTMVAQANGIKVLIASITPTVDQPGHAWSDRRPNSQVVALNQSIQALCQKTGAVYVDYFSVLVDPNTGAMNVNLTVDGLHPNTAGFAAMVPVAQAALAQLGY